MRVIFRSDAKAQGLKRYFTGKPCKHGHVAERSVSSGSCIGCRDQKKQQRDRDYYLRHKSRILKQAKKYRDQNKEEIKKRSKTFRSDEENKIKIRFSRRRYRLENREKIGQKKRLYYEENNETIKARTAKWRLLNRERALLAQKQCYYRGPQNPSGEKQWLRKARADLRSARRALRGPRPEATT